MSHDCQRLHRRLDDWPLLDAMARLEVSRLAVGCAACSTELAAAQRLAELLEEEHQRYDELRYGGPMPDFSTVLGQASGASLERPQWTMATARSSMPRWRPGAIKRLLSLAALLLTVLGLSLVWLLRVPSVDPRQAIGEVLVRDSYGPRVTWEVPRAPQRPSMSSLGSLSPGRLRRPTPPSGGRPLTFPSLPRPSAPAASDAGPATTDYRQGERS